MAAPVAGLARLADVSHAASYGTPLLNASAPIISSHKERHLLTNAPALKFFGGATAKGLLIFTDSPFSISATAGSR